MHGAPVRPNYSRCGPLERVDPRLGLFMIANVKAREIQRVVEVPSAAEPTDPCIPTSKDPLGDNAAPKH